MNSIVNRPVAFFLLVGGGVLSAGCDRGKALPDPSLVKPDTSVAAAPVGVQVSGKAAADAVGADELKEGLDIMLPLVVSTHDGYAKVQPKNKHRFFMHPDADRVASIEFDTRSLSTLTLSPHMEDFSTVKDCAGNPAAGVVRMSWNVQDGSSGSVVVDRSYAEEIAIDLKGASWLKVEVDNGNQVPWCDWFSLGFKSVRRR